MKNFARFHSDDPISVTDHSDDPIPVTRKTIHDSQTLPLLATL